MTRVNKTMNPDNGFLLVLDNWFGKNSYQTGLVSHHLYIHEAGTLPDLLHVNQEGIEIIRGMKHDVTITSELFDTTDAFREMTFEARQCVLETDSMNLNTSGDFRFFKRYTMTHCVAEIVMESSRKICNCTPLDLAEFLHLQDYTVKTKK